jgi:membrane-bound serine protease (ClpP class)
MNIFLDPNVAYLLLVSGFLLAILALFSPGTGFLELGALFAVLLAGYSVANLPINIWALLVLLLGVFPFLLALRRSRQWFFMIVALVALVVGSIFLFRTSTGAPAVNPVLASLVSLFTVGLLWLIGRKGLEAIGRRPSHRLEDLIGSVGEARADIQHSGTVYVNGEEWSAHSDTFIAAGSSVRVTGRNGLILIVEPV